LRKQECKRRECARQFNRGGDSSPHAEAVARNPAGGRGGAFEEIGEKFRGWGDAGWVRIRVAAGWSKPGDIMEWKELPRRTGLLQCLIPPQKGPLRAEEQCKKAAVKKGNAPCVQCGCLSETAVDSGGKRKTSWQSSDPKPNLGNSSKGKG